MATYRAKLFQAWSLLTAAQPECNTTSAKFDVADVGREWLQQAPCTDAWDGVVLAWNASNHTALVTAGQQLVRTETRSAQCVFED